MAPLLDARRTSSEHYVDEEDRILLDDTLAGIDLAQHPAVGSCPPSSRAGRASKIFFDPPKTRAGIVTCGGLCPGLNNVIARLVLELTHDYGVRRILGLPLRLPGLHPRLRPPTLIA